ncbi:MAG: beta-1,6-N-acetylglucosaminyltransferase [Rouxiella badensis]|uniref:beta-1,6-N-acetylglucosaminyltransferase n=1 Tax=Rouxiella badensis TaxID=1646377 RepID=UPI003C3B590B
MKKIIAIVCHKVTAPLIHTIEYLSSYDNNSLILHVDAKSNINDFHFLEKKNVRLVKERVDVQWGRFSQIEATLRLMKSSIGTDYAYFFLISGDDIPVMSNQDMDELLVGNIGKEFIHYQDSRNSFVDPTERVRFVYPEAFYERKSTVAGKLIRKFHKLFKNQFFINKKYTSHQNQFPKLYKGTNWFTLTRESVEFIINYVEQNKKLVDAFSSSLCADEVFFHSILKTKSDINIYHDPLAINNALRYIDWVTGPEYPRILNDSDRDKIIKSGALFARKVGADADKNFMNSFI